MRKLTILLVLAFGAMAQRHSVSEVDTEKPDGKLLQQIMQSNTEAQKTTLLEQFLEQFPKADAAPWAMEQLLAVYSKSNQPDKTIAIGEKLLAVDPDETEAALQCLKASEAKHDSEGIKKYSAQTAALAKKMQATPQPKDADMVDNWKLEMEYAKQVGAYCEFSLYRAGLEATDPKLTIEFADLLAQRYPQGQYAGKLDIAVFRAYGQTGQTDKAVALAERVVATDQTNEDMLLVVADSYSSSKKNPEKVHAYCEKIVQLMTSKPKPEGTSDETWNARKSLLIGQARYMNGKLYFNENHFPETDRELKAALPLLESNPAAKAETLYLLGFVNYKMDKPQDAANYYRACSALKSNYQAMATKNLAAIKGQYSGIK